MLWTDSSNEIVHSVIPIVKTILERVERCSPSGFHVHSAVCFAILLTLFNATLRVAIPLCVCDKYYTVSTVIHNSCIS
jgi:hypothetical protein